ncbi:ATP-binding protein [Streptomyces albireticuli]|uniref:ATP-binding protein n=1 Tax=Streptomyces albireticuli TaxID=1940 RepID=UPI0014757928|nr:ATP-binding protein [Streptomyces albireticuli]MCD9145984.1 ATP-binding protein [Streptomyces albireticuli]MCD9165773.1 ATP-binding protein [Streptomyces albireticuli]MCD9195991.1 ATP-binding protein [Streptomyces albireticuli]
MPRRREAVSEARRTVRRLLLRWGVGAEEAFEAELFAAELLANALGHALPGPGGEIGLQIAKGRRGVLVEVEDGGSEESSLFASFAAGAVDDGESEHGRGLLLVEELGRGRWGWRRLGNGHRSVWAYVVPAESRGAR